MKKDETTERKIEAAFNSIDAIQRASPQPYLFTRINARLQSPVKNFWEKTAIFISHPSVMIAGICLLLTINISVLVFKSSSPAAAVAERSLNTVAEEDDEYNTLVTIDNIENP